MDTNKRTRNQKCVFELIKQHGMRRLYHVLKKDHKSIFKEVQNWFGESFGERVYCYVNGIEQRPKCETCGVNPVSRFYDYFRGYGFVCSNKCAASHPAHLAKRKRTCLERYGTDSAGKSPEVERKRKLTMIKRHGTDKPVKVRWRDPKK